LAERERNIVREGGIGGSDAQGEDVSRDTYGFTGSPNTEEQMSPEEARRRAEEVLPDAPLDAPGDESGDLGPKD
jgi:hypothetical protein